jgi:hypothetical protein
LPDARRSSNAQIAQAPKGVGLSFQEVHKKIQEARERIRKQREKDETLREEMLEQKSQKQA